MQCYYSSDRWASVRLLYLRLHPLILPQNAPKLASTCHPERDGRLDRPGGGLPQQTRSANDRQLDGRLDARQNEDGASPSLLLCRIGNIFNSTEKKEDVIM